MVPSGERAFSGQYEKTADVGVGTTKKPPAARNVEAGGAFGEPGGTFRFSDTRNFLGKIIQFRDQ